MNEILARLAQSHARLAELGTEAAKLTAEALQLELTAIERACATDFDPTETPATELPSVFRQVVALRRDRDALRARPQLPALGAVASELTWARAQPGFDEASLDGRSVDRWLEAVAHTPSAAMTELAADRVLALRRAMVKTAAHAILAIESIDRQRAARQGEGPDAPR